MVSFSSISQGVNLLIVASCLMLGSSEAAPVVGSTTTTSVSSSTANATTTAATTTEATTTTDPASFPTFPSSGLSGSSGLPGLSSGGNSLSSGQLEKLKDWFSQHGGSNSSLSNGDLSKIKEWFSQFGTPGQSLGSSDFSKIKDWLEQYKDSSELSKRDSVVSIATTEQINTYKKYAGVASAAYCNSVASLKSWNCVQCKKAVSDGKIIKTFKSIATDTNGFVMTSAADKTIYLVFRGSVSAQNWASDFQATPVSYSAASGAMVHSGFYTALKDSSKSYFSTVQDQLTANPDYKVIVTGHSLGAALALLGGMDLYQRDKRITSENLIIYTYGGPRVGNKAFANYVVDSKIPVYRSVNKMDPIPQTPPTTIGFVHPGIEAWKKTTGTVQICNTQIESTRCSSSNPSASNMMDHLNYYDINMGVCF